MSHVCDIYADLVRVGSLFVPFAFGLDWTGFSNIIDCLSKK